MGNERVTAIIIVKHSPLIFGDLLNANQLKTETVKSRGRVLLFFSLNTFLCFKFSICVLSLKSPKWFTSLNEKKKKRQKVTGKHKL